MSDALSHTHAPPEAQCFEAEAHIAEFDVFHERVKAANDPRELDKWVSEKLTREDRFKDLAVGTIRWPRSIGRPDSANLADGFEVRVKFWVDVWHIGLDGSIISDILGWMPAEAAVLRDGLADGSHYSVRYLFTAAGDQDNRVEVNFSNVPWRTPILVAHPPELYLSSHGFEFFSAGRFTALPHITVDKHPFFRP